MVFLGYPVALLQVVLSLPFSMLFSDALVGLAMLVVRKLALILLVIHDLVRIVLLGHLVTLLGVHGPALHSQSLL